MPNKKQQGNLGEISALKEFLKYGFKVSLPFGDNTSYDLIVEDNSNTLYKIQVKSSEQINKDGVYKFSTSKKRINTHGNYTESYKKNEVDYFVLYGVSLDELYILKFDEAGTNDTCIRVEPPKRKGGTIPKMREDYLLSKRINELFILK